MPLVIQACAGRDFLFDDPPTSASWRDEGFTPQLKHAIKILQLSRTDLETRVNEEMEQNPTIEELGVGQEDFEAELESRTPDERVGGRW